MARLIESSLWVDFTRRRTPPELKARIHPWILDPLAVVCEPVMFEVLWHATPDERPKILAQFATMPVLPPPPRFWGVATHLGQTCRDNGLTPGSMDLLIATIAIQHDAELVTFDTDFAHIAKVTPLKVRLLHRAVEG